MIDQFFLHYHPDCVTMCDVRNYSAVSPLLVVAVMVFIFWTLTNIGLYYDCSPLAPALEVARLLASAAGVLALGIYNYLEYLVSRYIILCINIIYSGPAPQLALSLSAPAAGWMAASLVLVLVMGSGGRKKVE